MYSSHMSINSHSPMEIDTWMSERPQSHIANSYSTGGQPPSLGDLRQTVLSEPSGGNQMYSDGQPPSLSDVGRRAPSQSEPSCNAYDYEGFNTHEDQEPRISEIGAEKNDINLELSLACTGPLLSVFNLPATRPHVVSNLQGHSDQLNKSNHQQESVGDGENLRFPQIPLPIQPTGGGGGTNKERSIRPGSMVDQARMAKIPTPEPGLMCPRCDSTNTEFCYFNNYSLTQPRHFCKTCRRFWTRGGAVRNVPVGGGRRRIN